MVIRELIKNTIKSLRESGNDNPVFEAHQLIKFVTKMDATELVIAHDDKVSEKTKDELLLLLERRIKKEPLQYILGTQEFMSLEFFVDKNVLIPRSDTETLTEYVIDKMKGNGFSLLDIGTGCGCIPLSIAHFNKDAYTRGLDINPDAVLLSAKNAEKLNLSDRATFGIFDILNEIPKGKYNVVTSNPPYIETDVINTLQPEVRDFEPHLALDGGADGLIFYRRICKIAPDFLHKNGLMVFEIGYNQGQDVKKIMSENFKDIEIIKDLTGNDRVVAGVLK